MALAEAIRARQMLGDYLRWGVTFRHGAISARL